MTDTLRQGIRHFHDLKPEELTSLHGFTVTEKTDGTAFAVGWDLEHDKFYSRTAHSPKTFDANDYQRRAEEKFGDRCNPAISQNFALAHRALRGIPQLYQFVHDNKCELKGEVFVHSAGEVDREKRRIKFVGTWYDLDQLSHEVTFVLHTKTNDILPDSVDKWFTFLACVDTDEVVIDTPAPNLLGYTCLKAEGMLREWLPKTGKWGDTEGFILHKEGQKPVKLMNPDFYTNKRSF